MLWSEKCMMELTHHNMFESSEHRLRFRDLVTCYYQAPFFTKGLCKCMYLSAWDEEHFEIMLAMLNELTIGGGRSLRPMREHGEVLEMSASPDEREIMKLSNAFIGSSEYRMPNIGDVSPDTAHILRRGLLAGSYIDELPDPHTGKSAV